jgi:hypothetical protein
MAGVGVFLFNSVGLESKGFANGLTCKSNVLHASPAETQLTRELDYLSLVQTWSRLHEEDRSARDKKNMGRR